MRESRELLEILVQSLGPGNHLEPSSKVRAKGSQFEELPKQTPKPPAKPKP